MKLVNQSKILMHLKMFLIMKLRLLWSFGYYHFHNFLRATHYLGIKRDDSAFIDQQGKNYLNYLISYLIYTIIASVLVFVYRRRLIVHPWYSNDHLFNRRNHICTQRRRLRCAFYDRVY